MADRLKAFDNATVKLPFVLKVDSNRSYYTVTTLHEGADYSLRPPVARMRGFFENGEISVFQCVNGIRNRADALTKRDIEIFRIMNGTMHRGCLQNDDSQGQRRIIGISSSSK